MICRRPGAFRTRTPGKTGAGAAAGDGAADFDRAPPPPAGGNFGDRATNGTIEEYWQRGELVSQTRSPSDRLLMFLLGRLFPAGDGTPGHFTALDRSFDEARAAFPDALGAVCDNDEMVAVDAGNAYGERPDAARDC